jgi:hypothetical protein
MKIPFLDEDTNCKCGGTGFIDHNFGTAEVPKMVCGICPKCVTFQDATVEDDIHDREDTYIARRGRIVPENF